ncbi:interferon-induced very large GTPase 1-like [Cyprinus carpio]|uniref:Interferon-induced very large GTPase 1-like n=1 Tax=Cyprinus carpio TaxID=7962 RepID=A0A9Q9VWM8_CYPCA|nr:interferon-induced very large GTPase 1-like [Cyprinus carpio]XP_042572570.1 interferon-induced very large GTPase 1-like [Cyprinus carpio]
MMCASVGDLRIVLLAKSLSENCGVGNLILGKKMFDSEALPDQVQKQRRMHKTVINVPHLLQPHLSDHQITEAVNECMRLSDPGPHVIILVLKNDQCSREDQEHVEKVLHSFSDKVYEHTMVLSTQEPDSEPTKVNDVIREIIKKCSNRHYQLKKSTSSVDLREKIENFAQINSKRYLVCDKFASSEGSENSMEQQVTEGGHTESTLTVALVGNSESIQFKPENILLGEDKPFKTVETSRIVPVQREIAERHVSVINMISLHETDSVHHLIDQLLNENKIHAFIFVVRLGQLTDADKMGLEWLQRVFGDKVLQFVMILFTYETEEECDTIIDDMKNKIVLEQLLEKCGGRYQTCNKRLNNQSEMSELINKIEHLFKENQQQCYTADIYNTVLTRQNIFQKNKDETDKTTVKNESPEHTTTRATRGTQKIMVSIEETRSELDKGKYFFKTTKHLFDRLHLKARHCNLRAADVLQLTEHSLLAHESCAEEELIQTLVQKLLMMNYRARYIHVNKASEQDQTQQRDTDLAEDSGDIFKAVSLSNKGTSQSDPVHPMDVQMAAFHCADSFLKQLMVTKLSQCQYALPLLVPDPFTQQIEFPLWTFRQINKSWKMRNTNNEIISQTQSIDKAETPVVFFFRFGSVSSSKSQLMNSLINEKHNTFFHRNCPGSSKTRVLMDGVVEIAWFCPSGRETDKFTECVAFCNLHGDAGDHEKQLQILTEMSSVNVVLLPRLDRNDKHAAKIQNLYGNRKPLICLFTEDVSILTLMQKGKYKIGLKDRCQPAVSDELRRAIKDCLSESSSTFRLEDVSKHSDIRVDEEDDDDCRRGREAAQQMMSLLEKKDLTEIKESFLPHQGKLWHQWSQKNKELHRPRADETEMEISKKHSETMKIREQQHECEISEFMKLFIKEISSHAENKMFFLKWLRILLDEYTSTDLSALHHKYYEKLSTVLKLKEKHEPEELTFKQTELERISEDLQAATFGLEHIMREIGQIYESCSSVKKNKKDLQVHFSSLPSLAAEMMISGFPLELMDGDAAHVPVIWISAVLDQLIQKLGDQRVFVLSVLGIQSSGKSTMLNAMFGLQFAVSAGRCTRGAFMQLIRVSDEMKTQMNFDYILVVDTEGLCALELGRSTRDHDNELATFAVGIGNLTLINIFGENPAEIQEILQIVVQAFMRMKKVRLNPSCVFVHQNVTDVTAGEKNMEGRRRLQKTLDEMTKLAAKEEVCDAECFSDIITFDVQNDVKYFAHLWEGSPPMAPPNPNYCENIQELKKTIMSHASKSDEMVLVDLKDRIKDLWEALLNERFVFSFRNSLEISAYRKLETKYSKWSWSLRSAMLETENKLHNKIENETIDEVDEIDLQRELKKTSEEVRKSMSEFFEKDTDANILIQWKTSFENKIKDVEENIVKGTKRKLNEIVQQRDLRKVIDAQSIHHENTLYEKSKELALKLKYKAKDEETLKKEFDLFWEQSVKKIIRDTHSVKHIDALRDVKLLLSDMFEGCLPRDHSKEGSKHNHIFTVSSYSEYVVFKKSTKKGTTEGVKDGYRTVRGTFRYTPILSPVDEAQIRILVRDVVQQTDNMIQSFNIAKMGYNISCIQQLTDHIIKKVKQHEEGPVKYVFKKQFFMDLVISICKRANKMITDQHRLFRETNDPVIYVEKKREECYNIFQTYCHGATSTAIFGKIICQKLKEPIEQSVYKKTARDLTDEMRSNCESLNGNRSNLEKHILKRLAEKEDFDKFMNYINNPKDHFKSFIRDEVSLYITDKFSLSVLPKMKENIKLLQQKIMKAAHQSTEHVQVNSADVGLWLKSFTQQLSDDLIFSEKDLSGVKHDDVDDFNLLEDVIREEITAIMFDISNTFNTETFLVNLDYKFRPDEILIDHFCQCCWVQCPFCTAICTNTIENHDEDHSVQFHRSIGLNGIHYRNTSNLSTHICTSAVANSNLYFYPNDSDDRVPWRDYRKAGGVYADWSITPDLSVLPYWKWFVCRFQKDLEKYYNNRFEGSGEIPCEWRTYSKQDATESLDKYN